MCRNPGGGLRDIKEGHTGAISVQQGGANHGAAQQRLEPIMEQHNRGWSQSWSSTTEEIRCQARKGASVWFIRLQPITEQHTEAHAYKPLLSQESLIDEVDSDSDDLTVKKKPVKKYGKRKIKNTFLQDSESDEPKANKIVIMQLQKKKNGGRVYSKRHFCL
ncbi:unnamed protein product [Knipowitschia caucasica]|uniref:Uncharacterized protein n=1 Tax=Knipowitschia caucasica TaxID=637954 RepID=A0AAV2J9Y3_KNICA